MGILANEAEERFYTLASHVLVGRSSSARLRLKSRRVSGEHARLLWTGARWEVRDLASRNGTFLNGRRLAKGEAASLSLGDCLAFGEAEERHRLVDDSPPVGLARSLEHSGLLLAAEDGLLGIPGLEEPSILVFEGPEGWIAEQTGVAREVSDGEVIHLTGSSWVLHLPELYEPTELALSGALGLGALELCLVVGEGGERVGLRVEHGEERRELPHAPRYRVLLALGRARGFPPAPGEDREGWVELDSLLERLGVDERTLDRQLLGIRRDLARLGVAEAAGVIERHQKKRALRLGPVGLREERASASMVIPETQISGEQALGPEGSGEPGRRARHSMLTPQVVLRSAEIRGQMAIDGRYRLIRPIGEGGMGVVYLAEHVGLGTEVALKLLLPHFAHRPELVERFRREAKAAAAIRHPNIIEVHDVGELSEGGSYMVLEYLRGREWEADFEEGVGQPLGRVAHIGSQLAGAVHAAHEAGILHRDLKPSNVFLIEKGGDEQFVKVLDFGLSKIIQEAEISDLTRSGATMGTLFYMSPELTRDARTAAEASDLWALGVILYRALSGRYPFTGGAAPMLVVAINFEEPPPLSELCPDLPEEVARLVHSLLEKEPERRPASAAAVREALAPFFGQRAAAP